MLLKEAHTKFIDYLKNQNRANATIIAYSKDIEQIIEHFNKKNISAVEGVDDKIIKDFMDQLQKSGYTAKSISRKTNSTKTFFKYLHTEIKVIETNPAIAVSHPKLDVKNPRILSKIEYSALRDSVKNDIRTSAILEVLLQCGLRISELASIKLANLKIAKNIDKEQGTLIISSENEGVKREVPLNKIVQEAIVKYLEIRPKNTKEYLFVTKTGKPLLVRNIRSTLHKCFKNLSLSDVKVNDLRHTFIAHHLKMGTPVYVISKIAGHKRVSTTEKYLQYIEVASKKQSVKLEEL